MNRKFYCIILLIFAALPFSALHAQTLLPCFNISDEAGDAEIQNATGTFAVQTARADLIGASLIPEQEGWLASVSTSQPFLLNGKERGNAVFMFDVDAITENNADQYEDVRGGSDLHYLIGPLASDPKTFGVRRYIFSPLGTWQQTRTSSTVDVSNVEISLHIPKGELSLVDPVRWRAWISMAVSGEWTVRDGAPTRTQVPGKCGFLPVPDQEIMSPAPDAPTPPPVPPTDVRPGLIALVIWGAFSGIIWAMNRSRT